jgi:serine/threonine-protein kinase RsbW
MTPPTPPTAPSRPQADAFRPGELVLEIPARTEFVSLVRVVVAAAAELEPHMDADRIDDLRVAVSEATTNAIDSHTSTDTADRIRIQCNLADEEIAVVVRDEGVGFDPDALPELPAPETPARLLHESGLGVRLMQLLTDESEIRSNADGTDVRLVVYSSKRRRRPRTR